MDETPTQNELWEDENDEALNGHGTTTEEEEKEEEPE